MVSVTIRSRIFTSETVAIIGRITRLFWRFRAIDIIDFHGIKPIFISLVYEIPGGEEHVRVYFPTQFCVKESSHVLSD